MPPFQLVYGKTCHLPVKLEHRAHWVIRQWNMDLKQAGKNRQIQLAELEEWREKSYHSARIYKDRTKKMERQEDQAESPDWSLHGIVKLHLICSLLGFWKE